MSKRRPPVAPEPAFLSRQVTGARYYLPMRPGLGRATLRIICAGVERAAPDYRIARPGFPWHGLEFVVAGRGRLRLAGREHTLQAGVVFSYGPGIPHRIETDPREVLTKYFVDFSGPSASRLLAGGPLGRRGCLHARDPAGTHDLFDALIRNGRHGGRRADEICALLLRALILQISDDPVEPAVAQSPAYATYRRASDLIAGGVPRVSSLQELAAAAHAHPSYLCRLFRRFEGRSPYQVLLDLKLRHAAALLREPGAMVKNAAREAGFDDPYHFSRLFKRHYGVSPLHFARAAR
jgi:AraC-like DNA-binding protein